jgi:hypothetical protein
VWERKRPRERDIWIVVLRGTSVRPTLIEVYWTRSVLSENDRYDEDRWNYYRQKTKVWTSYLFRSDLKSTSLRILSALGLTRHGFVLSFVEKESVVYKLPFTEYQAMWDYFGVSITHLILDPLHINYHLSFINTF